MPRYLITIRAPDIAPDATDAPGLVLPSSPTAAPNPIALSITGAAAGAELRLYDGAAVIWTGTAGGTGTDVASVDLAVGTHPLAATAQAPGETESTQATGTLVVDRVPTCTLALPAISDGLLVPLTLASPDLDLDGYLVSEDGTTPAADDPRWAATLPTEFLFAAPSGTTPTPVVTVAPTGDVTRGQDITITVDVPQVQSPLYAWVRDAAGHVSARAEASTVLTVVATATPVVHALPTDLRVGEDIILVVDVPQTGQPAPASAPPYPDEINITTEGQTFAPLLEVDAGAVVEWIWADGTHSRLVSPSMDFGSVAQRTHRLRVVPWSALRSINLGYDAGDGGSDAITLHPQQNVSAITGLRNATNLNTLCLSNNPITALDLSGCAALETVECYLCQQNASVTLTGAPAIKRLCLEDNNVSALDLTGLTALEDLRGAVNNLGPDSVTWGAPHVHEWHMCVRNNPAINLPADLSSYVALRELWIWSCGLTSLPTLPTSGALVSLLGSGNALPQAEVDSVLAQLDALGTSGGMVELMNSATPSATGQAHAAALTARGWTVHVSP